MCDVVAAIRDCPYSGSLKKIFVEAKIIELLTLQIDQITQSDHHKRTAWKPSDVDKLMNVKKMLDNDIYAEYSVENLSRMMGMNRTKLQTGFRETFGNTIFGYLSDRRLDIARQVLLDQREKPISEIAITAGYKNPQHFTAAFKRKFGVLPKDARLSGYR